MTSKLNETQDFIASLRSKKERTGTFGELKIDPHFQEDPLVAPIVEFAIKRNKNLLLVGPTGCGKSSLAINILARLKEQAEIFSCDGETSTDNLIGKPWIITDDKGTAKTVVAYGAALLAYKEGRRLMLEEVDHAVPDILASMHRIMETHSDFYMCTIGESHIISKSKHFSVIATANTIGTGEDTYLYAGTKPLNQAFMNRFSITCRMNYLKPDAELKVLINKTGIDIDIARKMIQAASDVRDAADPIRINGTPGSQKIASAISTRDLLEWADLIKGMLMSPKEAAIYAFLDRISEVDRNTIKTFIENRF